MRSAALFISHDIVGASMAGPGIRYYHLARVLAKHVETMLAVPEGSSDEISAEGFTVVRYTGGDWYTLAPYVAKAHTCIFPSAIADGYPQLVDSGACLVVDGYDPLLAEWLELPTGHHAGRFTAEWQKLMLHLGSQYAMGDFFICASERQRDWWLGLLEANGRINPATHGADPSLRNLIDVVAYGMPENAPVHKRPIVKDVWDGIGMQDKLIVWGGGLWPWLDPITAIRAVAKLSQRRDNIRLIFPGTRHPNPVLTNMPTRLADAKRVSSDLGLTDRHVFFGDWVPYSDWASLLLECDLALILHLDTMETRLAYRSRVLEYIWCGLPTVSTTGDSTSELIEQRQLGAVVDYEDVDGAADAINQLLNEDRALREPHFAEARKDLTWEKLAAPLVAYCQQPKPAADKFISDPDGEQIFFASPWDQLRQERRYYQSRIDAYESGKFIRTMKWFNRKVARLRRAPTTAEQVANGGRRVTHLYQNGAYYAQLSIYRLASEMCQAKNVLDIGSGDGSGAHYVASHGANTVLGIDSELQVVRFSEQAFRANNLRFSHHDAERLQEFAPASYDVALAVNTMESIYNLDAFFTGLLHVLRSDGQFIAAVRPAVAKDPHQSSNQYVDSSASAWHASQWAEMLNKHFASVRCYAQALDHARLRIDATTGVEALLFDTPSNTRVAEGDFTFTATSAESCQPSLLSAVFVCTNAPTADNAGTDKT